MVALGFHSVLLGFVEDSTGSQWAGQISESIELSLTYGLVISAAMFLSIMALLRFFVPWERIWGLIYARKNADALPTEKQVVEI